MKNWTSGGSAPRMSSLQKMGSFSVPDHLSQGLSMNLAGPSPLGFRGIDSLSQDYRKRKVESHDTCTGLTRLICSSHESQKFGRCLGSTIIKTTTLTTTTMIICYLCSTLDICIHIFISRHLLCSLTVVCVRTSIVDTTV